MTAEVNCSVWREYQTAQLENSTADFYYEIFSLGVNGFFLSALITLGIVGNLLIVYVLRQRKLRNYLTPYFIGLAVWDCSLMFASFPCFSLTPLIKGLHYDRHSYPWQFDHVYIYAYPLAQIFRTLSTWILVALSVERYCGICYPLHNSKNSSNRPTLLTLLISFLGLCFNIPRFFEISVCDRDVIVPSPLRQNPTYHLIYNVILGLSLTTLGPCVLMCILTCLILSALKKSEIWRLQNQQKSPNSTNQNQRSKALQVTMNRMLIAASVKFLVCTSVATSVDIFELFTSLEFIELVQFKYLVDVSNLLVVLNSALNFPIYFITGDRFRTEVRSLYRRFSRAQLDRRHSQYMFTPASKSNSPQPQSRKPNKLHQPLLDKLSVDTNIVGNKLSS